MRYPFLLKQIPGTKRQLLEKSFTFSSVVGSKIPNLPFFKSLSDDIK